MMLSKDVVNRLKKQGVISEVNELKQMNGNSLTFVSDKKQTGNLCFLS